MELNLVSKSSAEKFLGYFQGAGRVVLVGHANPDGDCLGCTSAMLHYLEDIGIAANVIVPGKVPEFLRFLFSERNGVHKEDALVEFDKRPEYSAELVQKADLIICMDFNALHRVDDLAGILQSASVPRLLIDHHPHPQEQDFNLMLLETEISSASELTFWLIRSMNELTTIASGKKKEISMPQAVSLYTGMMTDTNNFDNSVFPSTHRMAAYLLELGVNSEAIQWAVFNSYRENRIRLIGYLTGSNMKVDYRLKAACMTLSREQQENFDFKDGDTEGVVNMPLAIKDVMISAFFTEGKTMTRVSLRAKGNFVVNTFAAKYFNGGGHPRAAGGRIQDIPFKDIETYFFRCLAEYIDHMEIDN